MSYDRYSKVRRDGKIGIIPNVVIPNSESDYYEIYKRGETRLDNVSYQYYGDANYDWLIMLANPQYGSMEFSIPDGSEIRIPYPLSNAIQFYNNAIDNYNRLYK